MKIIFDNRGHLSPVGPTKTSLKTFEDVFVTEFKNKNRQEIFDEYQRYTNDLQKIIRIPFIQWIGGSFVTNKISPNDLDLITFIDYDIYETYENEIDARFSKWTVGNFYPKIDAYTVWEYPKNHEYHPAFQADKLYWQEWFSNSRFNRARKRFPKGFIQLNIN